MDVNNLAAARGIVGSKIPANYSAIKKDCPKKTINVIHYNKRLVDFEKSQLVTAILRLLQMVSATEEAESGLRPIDIEISGDTERVLGFLIKYGVDLVYISRNFLGSRSGGIGENKHIVAEYRSIIKADVDDMRATLKPLKLDR